MFLGIFISNLHVYYTHDQIIYTHKSDKYPCKFVPSPLELEVNMRVYMFSYFMYSHVLKGEKEGKENYN